MNTPSPPSKNNAPAVSLNEHDALPAGTRFGEFEILRVLGVGGFGIVYLAQDHSLQRQVALKEYMPAAFASRGQGPAITVRSGSFAETYAIGLRSFINEARLLARFDHPSLVKVYRFWEDNATAYMVMPYLQGVTLRDKRRAMTHPPDEAWMRSVIEPLLSALELLHREGVFHRDIAPDNILLPPEGPPILLDFGAARHVIGDRTQSLTAILKPSYAPIEQYAEMAQMRQGPWTDLYALGAVMHYLLFGSPPAPATARAMQDDGGAIEQRQVPGVSARFMAAVAWSLAVRPNGRPQNVDALRAAIDGRLTPPTQVRIDHTVPGDTALMPVASNFEATQLATARYSAPTRVDTAHMPTERMEARGALAGAAPTVPVAKPTVAAAASQQRSPQPTRSKKGALVAGAAALVVLGAAGVWQFGGRGGNLTSATPAASAALPVVAAASVAMASASTPEAPMVKVAAASAALPGASGAGSSVAGLTGTPATSVPVAAGASVVASSASAARTKLQRAGSQRPASVPLTPDDRYAAPAVSVAPPPAPVVEVASAVLPAGPTTARESCGKRVFLALAVCMDRECEKPEFRDKPDCAPVLRMKRSREPQN